MAAKRKQCCSRRFKPNKARARTDTCIANIVLGSLSLPCPQIYKFSETNVLNKFNKSVFYFHNAFRSSVFESRAFSQAIYRLYSIKGKILPDLKHNSM